MRHDRIFPRGLLQGEKHEYHKDCIDKTKGYKCLIVAVKAACICAK